MALPRALAPMLATTGPLPVRRRPLVLRGEVGRRAGAGRGAGRRGVPALPQRQRHHRRLPRAAPAWAPRWDRPRPCSTARWWPSTTPDAPTSAGCSPACTCAPPARRWCASTPVTLLLFDVLQVDDRPLLDLPYDERRAVLESLPLSGERWQVPPSFPGDGEAVLQATRAQGMEGVVAKRRDSRYEPGRRSDCWVKVKHVRRTSAVVVGWKPGEGGRSGRIGSLLLAVADGDGWAFAGHVGTGFSAATLAMLGERLAPLRRADPVLAGRPARARAQRGLGRAASWSARSTTRSGRGTAGCATRRTRACATTSTRGRWCASEQRHQGRRRRRGAAGRPDQPGEGALPERLHQGAGARLLHAHRPGAAAAPGRPRGDPQALPRRRRGPGLLREERPARHPRLGARRDAALARLEQGPRDDRLRRGRRAGDAGLDGQPRGARAAHAHVAGAGRGRRCRRT